MVSICKWHPDAGFCIDELRKELLWCEVPYGYVESEASMRTFADHLHRDAGKIFYYLNQLRADEGSSVTILCDNPDFNGEPNCTIECQAEWTGWTRQRFTADTLLECLERAEARMNAFTADQSKSLHDADQSSTTFQKRVNDWMVACFGTVISTDLQERNHRFFEESIELVQSTGMTRSEAHQLVDYTYGRAIGDPEQEAGGVHVTLAALCNANGIDLEAVSEAELRRVWDNIDTIRAKQAAKPKHSPLPQAVSAEMQLISCACSVADVCPQGKIGMMNKCSIWVKNKN
jgi:hypothetical protein